MLQITYFCEDNTTKNPIAPVKDYINTIIAESEELLKKGKAQQAEKLRRFALRLLAIIQHAAEHEGVVHPPLGDKMHGHPFYELRQKQSQTLVRIFYFAYQNKKLVLLHAYEKKEGTPALQSEINTAQRNYNLYISHPHKHEI